MLYLLDDIPEWNPTLKRLTKEQLAIPNLHMLGYADLRTSNIKLQNHYHHTMEITAFLKGTQKYYVDDTLYTVQGGDIFMTHPHEYHGNANEFQDVCEYVWFQFDLTPSEDPFLGLYQPYGQYLYQQLLQYDQRIKKATTKDLFTLREAFFLIASPLQYQKLIGYNLFLQFVIHNFSNPEQDVYQQSLSPEIQAAVTYINAHLYEDISVDVIADFVGLSSSRFKVRFKCEVGNTPHAYVSLQKINIAKKLLLESRFSITDIAHQLHFSSSHHFASVFKKYTGYSPSEFKKMNTESSQNRSQYSDR